MRTTAKIIKALINALIVLFIALIISIIWTGGFEVRLFGVEISCHGLANPIIFLSILMLFRFFLIIGWVNSLVLLLALLVSAAVAEGFLRIVDSPLAQPILKEIMQPSNVLGYHHVPLLRDRTIKINSHGLRDREFSYEKPEGVKRLLGIGDSFTFGYGVNLDDCYLKQLELELNRNGDKWEVINAGVTGYSMWQYLAYFEHYGYRYEPDLVTIGFYFDDFYGDPSAEEKTYSGVRHHSLKSIRLVNFSRNCLQLLQFRYRYLLGSRWLRSIEDRREYILSNAYHRLLSGKADQKLYKKFESRLREFYRIAKQHGARVLVIFIPDIVQLNHPELQGVNDVLKEICLRSHVSYLDMTSHFERFEDVKKLYLLPYDAHTSPAGHQIIAAEIKKKIKERMPNEVRPGFRLQAN
jgi:lysophospholipase L1-like esterase